MSARVTVVIPVLNAMRYLSATAPAVVEAARRRGDVGVIYVDNGSTDGSAQYVASLPADIVRVVSRPGATIAGLRNWGARQGSGEYLSFLDADCAIAPDYFDAAIETLRWTGAAATGCEYALPPQPNWIERALHDMHFIGRDRFVRYINSGNFFIRREAFEAIGGFREDLRTDEDSDIGQRLTDAGWPIYECTTVRAEHLGNPVSLREHYRRTVWHSRSMFASLRHGRVDRPTVMLVLHLLASVTGVALVVAAPSSVSYLARITAALLLQLLVPAATVAFRIRQTRRLPRPHHALVVYWLYYWARVHALLLIILRRGHDYRR